MGSVLKFGKALGLWCDLDHFNKVSVKFGPTNIVGLIISTMG